jgi:hypothetical protein
MNEKKKKKSHKHSNEELFNQKFHKQNGNILRNTFNCIINRERERLNRPVQFYLKDRFNT